MTFVALQSTGTTNASRAPASGSEKRAARRNRMAMAAAVSDNPRPMSSRALSPSAAGFTMIELLMAVAILAILMGIAAPSLRDLVLNARISGQANDLMTDLAMTRAEAVKRDVWTGMCPSSSGTGCTNTAWDRGWIAFLDADSDGLPDNNTTAIIRVMAAFDDTNTLVANRAGALSFRSSGMLPAGSTSFTLTLCDSRRTMTHGAAADRKGRTITISATGRATSERATCP